MVLGTLVEDVEGDPNESGHEISVDYLYRLANFAVYH
jgi:hypothetical protein